MFENGAFWSRRVRTSSQLWCPAGRGVWMFMAVPSIYVRSIWKIASHPGSSPGQAFPECALVLAIADADGAAGCIDGFLGEREIGDLLRRRLLVFVDVAVLGAVVDRPCGALGVEAAVDRPDAVLGEHVDGVFDRFLRLVGGLLDDWNDLGLVVVHHAIGL